MKKIVLVQTAVITVLIGILLSMLSGSVHGWPLGIARAGLGDETPPSEPLVPPLTPTRPSWRDAIPMDIKQTAPSVLPTPAPGETLVYFLPTDNVSTATVINLYNTDAATHTVTLRGYYYNGVQIYFVNFNVPAYGFQRLVTDNVAANPPASWATPVPYITSFGDSVYFASLSLPKGVKVDGYTLFDPDTGLINPSADQGAIPLRFSSDPTTVLLPTMNR